MEKLKSIGYKFTEIDAIIFSIYSFHNYLSGEDNKIFLIKKTINPRKPDNELICGRRQTSFDTETKKLLKICGPEVVAF